MSEQLAFEFERQRPRLRGVAYQMLGSIAEADDAVQEAWLRSDCHSSTCPRLADRHPLGTRRRSPSAALPTRRIDVLAAG